MRAVLIVAPRRVRGHPVRGVLRVGGLLLRSRHRFELRCDPRRDPDLLRVEETKVVRIAQEKGCTCLDGAAIAP